MKNNKRGLVALDLSKTDERILTFLKQFEEIYGFTKFSFLHVIPNMIVPSDTNLSIFDAFTLGYPIDEKIADSIKLKINKFFPQSVQEADVSIQEGSAYLQLIQAASNHQVDLLVVGNKESSEGSGITARKVARNTGADVLFISDHSIDTIKTILVPIDFSENAARALRKALTIRKEHQKVIVLYVVQLLGTDHYYGLSLSESFIASMEENARKSFKDFKNRFGFNQQDFTEKVVVNQTRNIASQLKDYILGHSVDFVIMGAKGHSAFENFLYGSVTENLVDSCKKVPILIIR